MNKGILTAIIIAVLVAIGAFSLKGDSQPENSSTNQTLQSTPEPAVNAAEFYGINLEEVQPGEDAHIHAGFQVYVDNELQDFSDWKYMNFTPCGVHEEEEEFDPAAEQAEKAHLHDQIGDVAHVHRDTAKWKDLFYNMNYILPGEVTGYINGKQVENVLEEQIHGYDSVVFFIGENSDIEQRLENRVTKELILEAEAMTESC